MMNVYDDDATDAVNYHLFEWAVDAASQPDVVANAVKSAARVHRRRLVEGRDVVEAHNKLIDAANDVVVAFEDLGLSADYEFDGTGNVRITFDDVDGVMDSRRRRLIENVVMHVANNDGVTVVDSCMSEVADNGSVTIGLMAGIGFGAGPSGIDPNFDPFATRNVALVSELDVNVKDDVLKRLDELVALFDGPYDVYAGELAEFVGSLDEGEKRRLAEWIEVHAKRVGVPGTTLEEVLHDVYVELLGKRRHVIR